MFLCFDTAQGASRVFLIVGFLHIFLSKPNLGLSVIPKLTTNSMSLELAPRMKIHQSWICDRTAGKWIWLSFLLHKDLGCK